MSRILQLVAILLSISFLMSSTSVGQGQPRRVIQPYHATAAAHGWRDDGLAGTVNGSEPQPMSFTILLRQENKDKLEQMVNDVSNPNSPNYGKYLSADQLAALVNPPKEDQDRVIQWVTSGLNLSESQIQNRGDSIKVNDAKVSDVAQLFQCQMHQFTELPPTQASTIPVLGRPTAPFHPRVIHRCVSDISIPESLADIITGTIGLMDFPVRWTKGPHGPLPIPVGPNPIIKPIHGHRPQAAQATGQQDEGMDETTDELKQADSSANQEQKQQSHAKVDSASQQQQQSSASSASTTSIPPHHSFRTKEQLTQVAMEFDREQLRAANLGGGK